MQWVMLNSAVRPSASGTYHVRILSIKQWKRSCCGRGLFLHSTYHVSAAKPATRPKELVGKWYTRIFFRFTHPLRFVCFVFYYTFSFFFIIPPKNIYFISCSKVIMWCNKKRLPRTIRLITRFFSYQECSIVVRYNYDRWCWGQRLCCSIYRSGSEMKVVLSEFETSFRPHEWQMWHKFQAVLSFAFTVWCTDFSNFTGMRWSARCLPCWASLQCGINHSKTSYSPRSHSNWGLLYLFLPLPPRKYYTTTVYFLRRPMVHSSDRVYRHVSPYRWCCPEHATISFFLPLPLSSKDNVLYLDLRDNARRHHKWFQSDL